MSLLDSDAEELKARAAQPASSGRKTNQSGLGALKSLSKYSNLTAKYRTTSSSEIKPQAEINVSKNPTAQAAVEHSRGTSPEIITKSVQSRGANAPTSEINSINEKPYNNSEVSAFAHPLIDYKVSADDSQSQCIGELSSNYSLENHLQSEVSAKSVQVSDEPSSLSENNAYKDQDDISVEFTPSKISEVYSQCKVGAKAYSDLALNEVIGSSTSQCKPDDKNKLAEPNSSNFSKAQVSAPTHALHGFDAALKSVQSRGANAPSELIINTNCNNSTDFEVGASTHSHSNHDSSNSQQTNIETPDFDSNKKVIMKVSAKSVQLSKQVRADVSANHVHSQGKVGSQVSAKIKTLEDEFLLPIESALTLSGSQKTILDFIYDQCVWNQGLVTGPITKVQLIEATHLNEETALSAVKRLRKKRMIDRDSYKDGKAGWTRYRIAELSYKEILTFRQNYQSSYLLGQQSQGKVRSDVSASAPSKIDSNLNNITNYTSALTSAPTYFNSWFKTLNFKPVHPINPMQVNSSIRRLVEERLEQEDAQNFINRFMTWLSGQGKVNSPIAIFCDKLKEYANEGDSAVLYVKTKEEIQIELEFSQNTEKMRQEIELIEKVKAFEKSKQEDLAFEAWYLSATDEELLQLQQPNSFVEFRSEIYKKSIKGIYLEKYLSTIHG